jgi:glycosidase
MPWDEAAWDRDLGDYYRQLVRLRRTSAALIEGGFQVLAEEPDSLVYLRDSEEELIVVVVHRGPDARPSGPLPVDHGGIGDGTRFTEFTLGTVSTVEHGRLLLPAMRPGVAIWRTKGAGVSTLGARETRAGA